MVDTSSTLSPFGQAFTDARKTQGPGGRFTFEDKEYTTDRATDAPTESWAFPEPMSNEESFQYKIEDLLHPESPEKLYQSVNPERLDSTLKQLQTTTGNDEVRSVLMEQLFQNLYGDKKELERWQQGPTSPFQRDFQKMIPPAQEETGIIGDIRKMIERPILKLNI
jgi:hypothetical protein